MDQLTIATATSLDMPAIRGLQARYFAARGRPVQQPQRGEWYVALSDQGIVAAVLLERTDEAYIIHQLFAEDTVLGKLGTRDIIAVMCSFADASHTPLVALTENEHIVRAALKRGWEVAGIALIRQARK